MSALGGLNKTPNGVVIGLVQLQLPVVATPGDLAAQTTRIVEMVAKARRNMSTMDLVVFPEYALHGLSMDTNPEIMCRLDGPEVAAFKKACRDNAIWVMRSRMERARAAHAITDCCHRSAKAIGAERIEKGAGVGNRHRLRRAVDQRTQLRPGFGHGEAGPGVKRAIGRVAVEQVGHQNRMAEARHPLCHLCQPGTRAERIHVKNDGARRPAVRGQ